MALDPCCTWCRAFADFSIPRPSQGKYEEAAHQCSQALAIWEPIGDEYSTNIVMALTNLAIVREMMDVLAAAASMSNPSCLSSSMTTY